METPSISIKQHGNAITFDFEKTTGIGGVWYGGWPSMTFTFAIKDRIRLSLHQRTIMFKFRRSCLYLELAVLWASLFGVRMVYFEGFWQTIAILTCSLCGREVGGAHQGCFLSHCVERVSLWSWKVSSLFFPIPDGELDCLGHSRFYDALSPVEGANPS